jgi:predicted porin
MQKKLIALAIAGLAAAPAFAQTNVTIYGVADLTFESVKADDAPGNVAASSTGVRRNRLQSNSSLLGFRGTEDLGNGVKAIFQLETSVGQDLGTISSTSGRDSFVGLNSGWGTVVLGFLTHPVRAMGSKVDLNPGATGIGFQGTIYEQFAGIKTGSGDRQQLVAYVTPSFAGFTGTVAYGPGETATAGTINQAELKPYMWQVAGTYDNGPLYAGLAYHQAKDFAAFDIIPPTGNQRSTHEVIRAAAKYTFSFGTTISGLYDRQYVEIDSFGVTNPGVDIYRDAWSLNVGQTFGAHTIHAGYSQANDIKDCGSVLDCGQTGAKMWSIGYEYALSKRTMLKMTYADVSNDADVNNDFYTAPVGSFSGGLSNGTGSSSSIADGSDPVGFGIGLRHSF